MDNLEIELRPMQYETGHKLHSVEIVEFLINDIPLSVLLKFERGLNNCGCDLDPATRKVSPGVHDRFLSILSGTHEPVNQFGSRRTVLYRCHCGSDYCGVVSCDVNVSADKVDWSNVGVETDNNSIEGNLFFRFDKKQYLSVLSQFGQQHSR
jgi:hypothetical protein